jgi:hypothetical protein
MVKMWIRNRGWKKFGSGINILDNNTDYWLPSVCLTCEVPLLSRHLRASDLLKIKRLNTEECSTVKENFSLAAQSTFCTLFR